MAIDADYDSVSLLLHMEGSDEGTTFTDNSPIVHTVTANGDANTEVDQFKFGSSSLQTGTAISDYLSIPNSDTFDFDADFTIEFFCWPHVGASSAYLTVFGSGGTFNPWIIGIQSGTSTSVKFWASSAATSYDIANNVTLGEMVASSWNHIAVCREGNTWNLYMNGVRNTTFSNSNAPADVVRTLHIGGDPAIGGAGTYIDEYRLTKGVARYTGASFTVPTAAFPDEGPISPAVDVLVITGEMPVMSLSDNPLITPGEDALVLTGEAPSLAFFFITEKPDAGAAVFTGEFGPTLVLSDNLVITPGEDALVLTGQAPTIDVFITFDLAGSHLITTYAPGVQATLPMLPGEDVLAFTGELPGISRYLSVVHDSLFLTGQAPDLIALKIFGPAVGAMTLQGGLPVATVQTFGGDVSFEVWTATGDAENSLTSSESKFEPWTAVAVGLWGSAGTGAPALEAWTAQGFQAPGGAPSLEPWISAGTAESGRVGAGAPRFKAWTSEGTAPEAGVASGAPTFQALLSVGAGGFANDTTGSPAFRRLQAAGAGIGGQVGVGVALFKALTGSGTAYGGTDAVGASEFARLVSSGTAEAALDATLNTWVMNTRTSGVTAYPGYPANSFARYNGTYLAAGPTGLFLMQGADSDGVDWALATGAMDDDKPELKRLVNVLMGLRYDNPVRVTVTKDADISYEYSFDNYRPGLLHQARVPIGKGMRSRYYKVGLVGTGRFELDSMQVDMPRTSRRVG